MNLHTNDLYDFDGVALQLQEELQHQLAELTHSTRKVSYEELYLLLCSYVAQYDKEGSGWRYSACTNRQTFEVLCE